MVTPLPAPSSPPFRDNLKALALELEGRCRKIRDAHFEAARRWDSVFSWLGVTAVVVGVIGGGTAGSGILGTAYPGAAAVFAAIAGILAATTAFLKPSDRSAAHKRAGDTYAAIRDEAAELYALNLALPGATDPELLAKYEGILKELQTAATDSPVIPTWAWNRVDRWNYQPTLAAQGPSTRASKRRP